MSLSEETKFKIRVHLDIHWKHPRICPICKSSDWYVQPGGAIRPVFETMVIHERDFVPGVASVPTIQAVCKICFYVHTFLLIPIVSGEGGAYGG